MDCESCDKLAITATGILYNTYKCKLTENNITRYVNRLEFLEELSIDPNCPLPVNNEQKQPDQ